jgi:hypothetical protein
MRDDLPLRITHYPFVVNPQLLNVATNTNRARKWRKFVSSRLVQSWRLNQSKSTTWLRDWYKALWRGLMLGCQPTNQPSN